MKLAVTQTKSDNGDNGDDIAMTTLKCCKFDEFTVCSECLLVVLVMSKVAIWSQS